MRSPLIGKVRNGAMDAGLLYMGKVSVLPAFKNLYNSVHSGG